MGAFNEVCPQPVTFDRVVDEADGLRLGMVLSLEDWSVGSPRLVRGGPLCSSVGVTSGFVTRSDGVVANSKCRSQKSQSKGAD